MDYKHHRKCWDCGNIAIHESNITPGVLCQSCGSQDTRKIANPDDKPLADAIAACTRDDAKPYIKVTSVFGQSEIEVSDGRHAITLQVTADGIADLIDELQTVLSMADSSI
ncbi:MAG: hypothetical protein WBD31_06435 [Rubripirellula sp.]